MLNLKPLFVERMKKLLGEDFKDFLEIIEKKPKNIIRCNTLKTNPIELKEKLQDNNWKIYQPYENHQEIMIINELKPGELGNSREHIEGLFFVQDISSMMSVISLEPKENELILDLCAAPGSKTTQMSMVMKNKGTIIANDSDLGRLIILNKNLARCGCMNTITTNNDAVQLCNKLKASGAKFDKILVDAPCSDEGTLRNNRKIIDSWNINTIKRASQIQKKIITSAIPLLKDNGELVYSTCSLAPEENEEVINLALENFDIKVEALKLPIKTRQGILEWQDKKFNEQIKLCNRIYHQDNDSDGFFVAKLRKL